MIGYFDKGDVKRSCVGVNSEEEEGIPRLKFVEKALPLPGATKSLATHFGGGSSFVFQFRREILQYTRDLIEIPNCQQMKTELRPTFDAWSSFLVS